MHVQWSIIFKHFSIKVTLGIQVQGVVQDKSGKTLATLFGKWDESMHYVDGDLSKGKGHESLSKARLLWKRSKPPEFPTRYNLTRFAITMNELTPGLKVIFLETNYFSRHVSLFVTFLCHVNGPIIYSSVLL